MAINTPTAPAPKIEQDVARKFAEKLLAPKLEVAKTVAEYRKAVEDVLTEAEYVQGLAKEVQAEVKKVADNMDEHDMASDHGTVKIGDLGKGVKGVNVGLSDDTAIHKNELTVTKLTTNHEDVAETLDHEDSKETGHAGQTGKIRTVIDAKGEAIDKQTQLEGEVEANQGKEWRGNASAKRADQPEKVYGEGQDFISKHHDAARAYIRKDGEHAGDAVKFQAEVLKKSAMTPLEIAQNLQQQTDFNHQEIVEIVTTAKQDELAELMKKPEYAMAA